MLYKNYVLYGGDVMIDYNGAELAASLSSDEARFNLDAYEEAIENLLREAFPEIGEMYFLRDSLVFKIVSPSYDGDDLRYLIETNVDELLSEDSFYLFS